MNTEKNTCVGITGGSGFVGSYLTELLVQKGYRVIIFDIFPPRKSRDNTSFVGTDFMENIPIQIYECDMLVHLAGAPIDGVWTREYKQKIYDTRILSLRKIIAALRSAPSNKIQTLVSASAIGIYGDRAGAEVSEESPVFAKDFLSRICLDWESEVRTAREFGVRTVSIRTGIVLGKGGFVSKVEKWYRRGFGAILGSGHEMYNWIHIADLVQVYMQAIEDSGIAGPVCAVAPVSSTTRDFADVFSRILGVPRFFRLPPFLVRFFFKEQGQLFLSSVRVVPEKLQKNGFIWQYETLQNALESLYSKSILK